jgi:hypothetical protein
MIKERAVCANPVIGGPRRINNSVKSRDDPESLNRAITLPLARKLRRARRFDRCKSERLLGALELNPKTNSGLSRRKVLMANCLIHQEISCSPSKKIVELFLHISNKSRRQLQCVPKRDRVSGRHTSRV